MHITVNESMFIEKFRTMDRMENFSIDGLKALYEFLEDMERDIGQDYELDVIGLCCDFTEDSWEDVLSNYSDMIDQDELNEWEDWEKKYEVLLDFLKEQTSVIYHDGDKVLYQNF